MCRVCTNFFSSYEGHPYGQCLCTLRRIFIRSKMCYEFSKMAKKSSFFCKILDMFKILKKKFCTIKWSFGIPSTFVKTVFFLGQLYDDYDFFSKTDLFLGKKIEKFISPKRVDLGTKKFGYELVMVPSSIHVSFDTIGKNRSPNLLGLI